MSDKPSNSSSTVTSPFLYRSAFELHLLPASLVVLVHLRWTVDVNDEIGYLHFEDSWRTSKVPLACRFFIEICAKNHPIQSRFRLFDAKKAWYMYQPSLLLYYDYEWWPLVFTKSGSTNNRFRNRQSNSKCDKHDPDYFSFVVCFLHEQSPHMYDPNCCRIKWVNQNRNCIICYS